MSKPEAENQKSTAVTSGLNRTLLTVLFVAMLLPTAVVGFYLVNERFDRTVDEDSVSIAQHYGSVLESGMVMPLWNLSPGMGMPVIESISADKSVISVQVFLQDGETFLEFQRRDNDSRDFESIEIQRPIIYDNNQLGRVQLVYSLERAALQSQREIGLLIRVFAAQLVFVLLVMFFVFRAKLSTPLNKVLESVETLVAGDLSQPVPVVGKGEYQLLAERLEAMRVAVNSELGLLERRLDERTKELSTLNSTLRNTLDQLHHTYDQLVQADKMSALGNILTDINKELVSPIRSGQNTAKRILERNEVFKSKAYDGLTELSVRQHANEMEEDVRQLCLHLEKAVNLISDVEQMSVEAVALERRNFSLLRLLNETCTIMAPAIKRTPFRVVVDMNEQTDVVMDSFPHALGQVMQNVIGNALLHAFHNRASGDVVIAATRNGDVMEVTVSDNGVGISPENQPKIFERFFTTRKNLGGMGLGMHIVKVIVGSVLGGEVSVDSTLNVGTTVTVVVPIDAPQERVQSTIETSQRSSA